MFSTTRVRSPGFPRSRAKLTRDRSDWQVRRFRRARDGRLEEDEAAGLEDAEDARAVAGVQGPKGRRSGPGEVEASYVPFPPSRTSRYDLGSAAPATRPPLFPLPANVPTLPATPKKRPSTPDYSSPPPKRRPLPSTRPKPPPSPTFALLDKPFNLTSPSNPFPFTSSSLSPVASSARSTPPSSPAKQRESPRKVPYVLMNLPRKTSGSPEMRSRRGNTVGESPSKRR